MQRLAPQRVGPNKVPVYYAGGAEIDRFRGVAQQGGPEDWVASVTAFPPHLLPADANPETGISRLLDGTSLRAAIADDPLSWLGPDLAGAFGTEPGLLVKLLMRASVCPSIAIPLAYCASEATRTVWQVRRLDSC